MHLNHPETLPLPHPWKNCLSGNWLLVPKRLGGHCSTGLGRGSAGWGWEGVGDTYKDKWEVGLLKSLSGNCNWQEKSN